MPHEKSKLVYSTDHPVPRKEGPAEKVVVPGSRPVQQHLTVRLDRKGRGGKSVTIIEGLQMQLKEKEALLKQLKASLGTGGTLKDTAIEIQGDHRDPLMTTLEKMGHRPKRSGG